MSISVGPPIVFVVSDVYVSVGDTISPRQKYLSIQVDGQSGQIDLLWCQTNSTVTQIAAKGHEIDLINNPDDLLISVE